MRSKVNEHPDTKLQKRYFAKTAGLAAIVLLVYSTGFAQQKEENDKATGKPRDNEEIIIKRKSDKNAKVTVEIKDGEVLINGKPVSEFEDDNISVRKRMSRITEDRAFNFSGLEDLDAIIPADPNNPNAPYLHMAPSPFRDKGGWNNGGDEEYRNIKRAFLGVSSEKPGADSTGARIREVSKGSAAEKAGLQRGDVITRVDEIAVEDPRSLAEAIQKYKPEDKVVITYKRNGKEQKATVTLGKYAKTMDRHYNFNMPNIEEFKMLTPPGGPGAFGFDRGENKPRLGIKAQDTEDGKGVKVVEVDEESAAGKAGIKEGDIITRFEGKEVNGAAELAGLARESREKTVVKIGLTRDGKSTNIEVKIPKKLRTAEL
jgi:serine protease Do